MLYDVQEAINEYFNTNWTETPVKYDGIRFSEPENGKWISIQLIPYARENETLGTGVTMERGVLKIFSYDQSATLAYKLSQRVALFIENTTIDGSFIDVGKGDGNGAIPLQNDIYEALTIFEVMLSQKLGA